MEDKIDPVFLTLMKSSANTNNQKYNCIIYTDNSKALAEKGITINSVLPTFVTAVATLKQMQQIAKCSHVSYIEAPQNDKPQQLID